MIQDGRHRCFDVFDTLLSILVEGRPRRKPDIDRARVSPGRPRPGMDPGDGILDDFGEESGAGDDPIADAPGPVAGALESRAEMAVAA